MLPSNSLYGVSGGAGDKAWMSSAGWGWLGLSSNSRVYHVYTVRLCISWDEVHLSLYMVHTFWHWKAVLCSVASWSDLNAWLGRRWTGAGQGRAGQGVIGILLLYDLSLRKRRPEIPLGFYRYLLAFCSFLNYKCIGVCFFGFFFAHLYILFFLLHVVLFIHLYSYYYCTFTLTMLLNMTILQFTVTRGRGNLWVKIDLFGIRWMSF